MIPLTDMKAYHDLVEKILSQGFRKANRTGTDALTLAGMMFEHDMAEGFPLLTTKKVPFKLVPRNWNFLSVVPPTRNGFKHARTISGTNGVRRMRFPMPQTAKPRPE